MGRLDADTPIRFLRGIGPVRSEWFARAGLNTVGALLEYFPFRYEQESGLLAIADLRPGQTATVRGTVQRLRGGGRFTLTAEIDDGTASCVLRWFQPRYAPRGLCVEATVTATGKVREYDGRLELVQPKARVLPAESASCGQSGGSRLVGVYPASGPLTSALVRRAVEQVLAQPELPVEEFLPPELLRRHGFFTRDEAIRQIHAPSGSQELARARARLAYEELLLLELGLALRRLRATLLCPGLKLTVTPEIDRRIRARFPFELTAAQNSAIREIVADLESGRPMTRLLQGDVGSGKTVVALYACLVAVANRRQAAIMTPTEVLARQHFANISQYLSGSRVRCALLAGGLPATQRRQLLTATQNGQIDLIVGTQALIQQDVTFSNLALVVVDEQHKFGVLQRAAFRTKGPMPHYLVMTATPIPRTLAMTVFGDLDVSVIRELPPGRGRVTTQIAPASQWTDLMSRLRPRLEAGEQAYVVCPQIGDSQDRADDRRHLAGMGRSVRRTWQQLVEGPWRGLKIGLLHGGLSTEQQQQVIAQFVAGELHALVATTVVEVGVDVPNAAIMVIQNAERFGLSQLHQLRGRIGRGRRDGWCFLVTGGGMNGLAAERLKVLTQTTNGFEIAEADLSQRGPGELFGTRQHGLPELRVADLVRDFELLEKARQDAFELARRDPTLSQPHHRRLLPRLRRMFGQKLALIDAG
jgi:ATP-dependent DNA helicase RecG